MDIKEKLEGYLMKLSLNYEEVSENAWAIRDHAKGLENIIVMVADPVILLRVKVMEIPKANREKYFETLLTLNATEMVHGAYAIEGANAIIVDSLEAATMDLEEFQASIDSIGFALASHYQTLEQFRK
ncbi:MAG: hypothetical protein JW904_08880 [Spirochaetales bacterium]|nr:hypothetical protein [Spirochaetales bacterium]